MSLYCLKSVVLASTLTLIALPIFADQPGPGSLPPAAAAIDPMQPIRDNLGGRKQAFIQEHMKLSSKEAAKFWPLYFAYQEGLGKLNYRVQGNQKFLLRSWNAMTDTAVKDLVNEAISIEDERGKLTKEYMKKFLEVLPAKKVAHYFVLEYKFRSVVNYDLAAGLPLTR